MSETRTPVLDLTIEELLSIVEHTRDGAIGPDQYAKLRAAIHTFALLHDELQSKRTSIQRLKQMLFGARTETTREVLGEQPITADHDSSADSDPTSEATWEKKEPCESGARSKPRKGHGRNGAFDYPGADKVKIEHPALKHGELCSGCCKGKLYPLEPAVQVRFRGVAPLQATVYERSRLRCALCGEVFTAPSLPGVGEQKYDETVPAVVGLMHYGTGLPFNQIEKLQENFGIPLPASSQWELVQGSAGTCAPVHEEFIRQAADGTQVYNDDTTMRVLNITPEQRAAILGEEAAKKRTGVFTSGIVSVGDGHQIALFFTGVRHAGENLADMLRHRSGNLPPPIQMCDALESNLPAEFETLLCRCNVHARRKFVEVAADFPEAVRMVLLTFKEVYKVDAEVRKAGLSPAQRLQRHQLESGPRMQQMREKLLALIDGREIEPNSGLGKAIRYMKAHWEGLTRFLHVENAPLDNNITERCLKRAIRHRRNSLFYKTLNGAHVGDVFMTLIHTAELNGVNAFDYLAALLRHPKEIAERPGEWMPWTYRATLARLSAGPDPPA